MNIRTPSRAFHFLGIINPDAAIPVRIKGCPAVNGSRLLWQSSVNPILSDYAPSKLPGKVIQASRQPSTSTQYLAMLEYYIINSSKMQYLNANLFMNFLQTSFPLFYPLFRTLKLPFPLYILIGRQLSKNANLSHETHGCVVFFLSIHSKKPTRKAKHVHTTTITPRPKR